MSYRSLIICMLSVSVAFFQIAPAYAGIVGTNKSLQEYAAQQQDRETLRALMARDEVQALLSSKGLSVEQAQKRVDALTDSEARMLAEKFEEQPAGGILIALLIILLVFIILELAGVTDVFTGI